MGHDGGSRGWAWVAVAAVGLGVAAPASGQKLNGSAEVNYQSVDRVRSEVSPLESWVKTFRMNYGDRIFGDVDLASQLQFSEQTIVGRPDRFRNPQGSLRLAQRFWGLTTAFQPSETRDAQGLTTHQQSLSLTGYAQKPGLPSIAGSWIRSHLSASEHSPESATITRGLSSVYNLPNAGFHAAYSDRFLENEPDQKARIAENNLSMGSNTQFRVGKAPISLRYDYSQSRATPAIGRDQRSWVHTAGANSSYQFNARTSSSLSYTFQRTAGRPGGTRLDDHNGSAALAHVLNKAFQVSAGAGVRSVVFQGQDQTESFLAATASGQGQVRTGWLMSGAATRSVNWLPGIKARPVDSFQSNTTMRLARGLNARADVTLSATRVATTIDTAASAQRQRSIQGGFGLTASPLRTVYLDGSVSRSRSGDAFFSGGVAATSYTTGMRLTPSPRLSLGGSWGYNKGFGSTGSTAQASFQWIASSSLQTSGAYSRARQDVPASSVLSSLQENYSGSLTMALGWDLRASVRYSDTNPRQSNEVRSVSASMSRNFGR